MSSQPKSCHSERSEECHSEGKQCPKKLRGRVYLPERSSFLVKNNWLSTVISSVVERSPNAKQFSPCQVSTPSCHSEGSEESPGKDTAYTPRRDDIQRLALMIYSHKWLMIYTASRDYGVKRKSITLLPPQQNSPKRILFHLPMEDFIHAVDFTRQGRISLRRPASP